jgi:phosphatidylcholine synthase
VFVPAAALWRAGYLGGVAGSVLGALILLSSLYHFADMHSKAEDHCFVGFPAIWNVVAFYVFALGMAPPFASAIAIVCVALTFVPLRWAHPLRTVRLLPVTLSVVVAWSGAAFAALLFGFPAPLPVRTILLLAAAYGLCLVLGSSLFAHPRRAR